MAKLAAKEHERSKKDEDETSSRAVAAAAPPAPAVPATSQHTHAKVSIGAPDAMRTEIELTFHNQSEEEGREQTSRHFLRALAARTPGQMLDGTDTGQSGAVGINPGASGSGAGGSSAGIRKSLGREGSGIARPNRVSRSRSSTFGLRANHARTNIQNSLLSIFRAIPGRRCCAAESCSMTRWTCACSTLCLTKNSRQPISGSTLSPHCRSSRAKRRCLQIQLGKPRSGMSYVPADTSVPCLLFKTRPLDQPLTCTGNATAGTAPSTIDR